MTLEDATNFPNLIAPAARVQPDASLDRFGWLEASTSFGTGGATAAILGSARKQLGLQPIYLGDGSATSSY